MFLIKKKSKLTNKTIITKKSFKIYSLFLSKMLVLNKLAAKETIYKQINDLLCKAKVYIVLYYSIILYYILIIYLIIINTIVYFVYNKSFRPQ
jgi:hypothetical protein